MSSENTELGIDPEVRQQEYQKSEQEKATEEKKRVDAAMEAMNSEIEEEREEEAVAVESNEQAEKREESKTALYSRLAEQDYELQQVKRQLKQRGQQTDPMEDLKQKMTENPLEVLQSLGMGIDEAIDLFVNDGEVKGQETQEPQKNEEIVALQEKIAAMESSQKEKNYNTHVANEHKRIDDFLKKEPGKWPLVEALAPKGSYKDVMDTVMAVYQQNLEENPTAGQNAVPQYSVVLDMVEEYYNTNMEQMIESMSKIEKFKHHFANNEKPEQSALPEQSVERTTPKRSATITSSWNDTASPHEPTDEERKRNAIAAIEAVMAQQEE